jgi:hypothetical protein
VKWGFEVAYGDAVRGGYVNERKRRWIWRWKRRWTWSWMEIGDVGQVERRVKGECGHVAMMLLMIDLCESVSRLR